jgi:lactoylglutathione lyase
MRGLALFVAGALTGLAATAIAQNQSPNRGIVGLHHVGLRVPDLDKAVEHYTKVLGFPEAFRVSNAQGLVQQIYVQLSQNTFVELQPASAQRPPGIDHFSVHVENLAAVTAMFKAHGANASEITRGAINNDNILSNIIDPGGNRMQLIELSPESPHRRAMERWR